MIPSMMKQISRLALPVGMALIERKHFRPLIAATHDPDKAQFALLQRILSENADTGFGKARSFGNVTSWESFRKLVPVQTYEALRPLVDAQEKTGSPELSAQNPVCYARTSGTTGAPKDVPVTPAVARGSGIAQKLTALSLYRRTGFFQGDILPLGSPSVEGRRPCGTPYGSASGQAYASLSALLKPKFLLPESVFKIKAYDQKYYVSVLLGLLSPRLTGIATANPSTLLKLRDIIRDQHGALITDLRGGCSEFLHHLDDDLRCLIRDRIRASQTTGQVIETLERRANRTRLADLWPDLDAILTWTGGSCGIAIDTVRRELPAHCKMVDFGYRASEALGTININAAQNHCVPALTETVLEFVERDAWEAGRQEFLTVGQLQDRQQYYVFVTTQGGLYRYDMNDILRVTGWINKTPLLEFVRKGKDVTNITGEKLCEEQVLSVARSTLHARPGETQFIALIGDAAEARYDMLLECHGPVCGAKLRQTAADFDSALRRENIEYDSKRASGRLGAIRAVPLNPGVAEHCKRDAVRRGQREAQYKPVCLALASDWLADLSHYQMPGPWT